MWDVLLAFSIPLSPICWQTKHNASLSPAQLFESICIQTKADVLYLNPVRLVEISVDNVLQYRVSKMCTLDPLYKGLLCLVG